MFLSRGNTHQFRAFPFPYSNQLSASLVCRYSRILTDHRTLKPTFFRTHAAKPALPGDWLTEHRDKLQQQDRHKVSCPHGHTAGTPGSCSIIRGTTNGIGLQEALEDDLLTNLYHINKVWTTRSKTTAWLCQGSQTVTSKKSYWDLKYNHTDCTKGGN